MRGNDLLEFHKDNDIGHLFIPPTRIYHESECTRDSEMNHGRFLPQRGQISGNKTEHLKQFFKENKIKEERIKSFKILEEMVTNFIEEI